MNLKRKDLTTQAQQRSWDVFPILGHIAVVKPLLLGLTLFDKGE
jgi:hypothetical protein